MSIQSPPTKQTSDNFFVASSNIFEKAREIGISDKAFKLYMFYLSVADEEGWSQFTNTRIALEMGWSRRTVIRMKNELEQAALIKINNSFVDNQQVADFIKVFYFPENLIVGGRERVEKSTEPNHGSEKLKIKEYLSDTADQEEADISYAFLCLTDELDRLSVKTDDWELDSEGRKKLELFLTMYMLWGDQEEIYNKIVELTEKYADTLSLVCNLTDFFSVTGVFNCSENAFTSKRLLI
ncbi:helix-turn-helix domain-containing protein [Limibacter armeniacum]|uniref:helix-turn-helix domain-containing protein n=1 Tax=Limibacter armeniacum TaxID=466084 RepID=UPI002FE68ADE